MVQLLRAHKPKQFACAALLVLCSAPAPCALTSAPAPPAAPDTPTPHSPCAAPEAAATLHHYRANCHLPSHSSPEPRCSILRPLCLRTKGHPNSLFGRARFAARTQPATLLQIRNRVREPAIVPNTTEVLTRATLDSRLEELARLVQINSPSALAHYLCKPAC